ncbi:hypothetical protein [Haloterrigena gelatinilytica]|uniref:hypothetical protein n=1 Tax=Haloterrigena gelatinilytica TaxID=2741724 RepID=UPI0020C61AF2|nr:hypothetical protein [Haloterrigena gelatinilytica]
MTDVGLVGTAVVFAVIGVTWAVISVTTGTIVTQLAPASIRGEAVGAYSALVAFAGGLGSVTGGWLAASSCGLAFPVGGGLVLEGAAVVGLLWYRTTTVPEPDRSVA